MKFVMQFLERSIRETGADPASAEKFVSIINSDEQGTEVVSTAGRFGITADDKFLLLKDLEFDPCTAALAGFVERGIAFANQTFQTKLSCFDKQLVGIGAERFGVIEERMWAG